MADTVKSQHIHILGIAGTMTAPLAVYLKAAGAKVTGCDQEKIYPPVSTTLQSAGIEVNSSPVDNSVDLAIIGSSFKSFKKCQAEFNTIKSLSIPYISATSYLAENLIRPNSVVVAGSFGKTTITAALVHIFRELSFNPSYFYGGVSVDGTPSLNLTGSSWSVIEGDESINGLDQQAKFLYYPVKYLVLTSTAWEHRDDYLSAAANLEAYRRLIKQLPADGLLIYNPKDEGISRILPDCPCPSFPFSRFNLNTRLIGDHNRQNLHAALTLCRHLGLDINACVKAIAGFGGIKRRLEILSDRNGILVIDDFAQSPERIKSALTAVSDTFPGRRIMSFFEPHASFLQNLSSLAGMSSAFELADRIYLGRISFSADNRSSGRVTAAEWKKVLGNKVGYYPLGADLVAAITAEIKPHDILVHFSSGGVSGLEQVSSVVKELSRVYNQNK